MSFFNVPALACVYLFTAFIASAPAFQIDPGKTPGAFQVTADGSAGYAIPIKCPPGTAGMQPAISLSYNSQAPSGSMGPGWSINGYSIITRGPKNLVTDGVVDGINFNNRDALFLDGTRLIPVRVDEAGGFTEYRKEINDNTRIRGYGAGPTGHANFRVWTKAGLIKSIGFTTDSIPKRADGTPILWLCNQVEDTVGNYINFRYAQHDGGDYNLLRVDYTGNDAAGLKPYSSIRFEYEKLADVETTRGIGLPVTVAYFAGEKVSRKFRLKQISSHYDEQVMRQYTLGYKALEEAGPETPTDSLCGFQLRFVEESGADGRSYRPSTFTYTDSLVTGAPAWRTMPDFAPPFDLEAPGDLSANGLGIVYANLDGVKGRDLLYSAVVSGKRVQKTFLNDGAKWTESATFVLPISLAKGGIKEHGIRIIDLNDDGLADLLANVDGVTQHALINEEVNGIRTWVTKPNLVPPYPLSVKSTPTGYILADITGDGKLDFLWHSIKKGGMLSKGASKFSSNEWVKLEDEFAPPKTLDSSSDAFVTCIDLNADMRADLVYWMKDSDLPIVYLMTDDGWELAEDDSGFVPNVPFPTNPSAILAKDLDGDGRQELIVSFKKGAGQFNSIFSPNAGGLDEWDSAKSLPSNLVNDEGQPKGLRFPDLNGDNKLDIAVSTKFLKAGTELRQAFIQTEDGWEVSDENFLPPYTLSVFANEKLTNLPVYFEDLDGDLSTDLIYQTPIQTDTISIPAKKAFLSSDDGWQESADFSPPFAIAKAESSDLGVRFVDFNADGLTDIVSSFKPKEGAITNDARVNLGAGWSGSRIDKWLPKYQLSEEEGNDPGVVFVDVNGDARADMLVHREFKDDKTAPAIHAFINDPEKGWVEDANWQPPTPITKDEYGNKGVRFVDLNGDGLTDVLSSFKKKDGNVEHKAWLNDRTKWVESPTYAMLPDDFSFAQEIPPLLKDDKPQVVPRAAFDEWNKVVVSRGLGAVLVDLNNDRLPDIAYHNDLYSVEVKEPEGLQPNYELTFKKWSIADYCGCKSSPPQ